MSLRTLIVLALTCAVSAWAPAQADAQTHATDQGSFILGGGSGLSSHRWAYELHGERHQSTLTQMYLSPRMEYFVRPGLAVGGTMTLSHVRADETSTTAYGVGPQITYFFGGAPEQTILPYLSARAEVRAVRGSDSRHTGYGGSAGVVYMLTRSVGLDASAFYTVQQAGVGDVDWSETTRHLGLAVGFAAFAF